MIPLAVIPKEFNFFIDHSLPVSWHLCCTQLFDLKTAKQPAFISPDHCRFDFHFATEEIYNFLNGEIVAEINFMLACGLNKIRVDS